MGRNLEVKVKGIKSMQRGLKMLAGVLKPKELTDEFGPEIVKLIVQRTRFAGLDVSDAPLKPLKDGGASYLTQSANMTSAVRYNPQARKIYIPSGKEHIKGHVHHYGTGRAYKFNKKPRRWFGRSPKDAKQLDKLTAVSLSKAAQRALAAGKIKKRGRVFTGKRYWKRSVAQ